MKRNFPDKELGQPKKPYDETFSAQTVIKEAFFPSDESYHPEWPLSSSHADVLAGMRRSSVSRNTESEIDVATLTFSDALARVKEGFYMHRLAWKPNKFVRIRQPLEGSLDYLELAYVDGRRTPWTPTRCDLMEDDWCEFSHQSEKIEERSRALIVAERLRDQAQNVETDGWINAARYMREAADLIETYRS